MTDFPARASAILTIDRNDLLNGEVQLIEKIHEVCKGEEADIGRFVPSVG